MGLSGNRRKWANGLDLPVPSRGSPLVHDFTHACASESQEEEKPAPVGEPSKYEVFGGATYFQPIA